MKTPKFLKRIWALINLASVLAWLLSLGVGGILSSLLANLVGLEEPWRWLIFVSVLLVGTALSFPLSRVALAWLTAILPQVEASITTAEAAETEAARDRGRQQEAALRSAILELEAELGRAHRVVELLLMEVIFGPTERLSFHRGTGTAKCSADSG
jgi:MFS family permease